MRAGPACVHAKHSSVSSVSRTHIASRFALNRPRDVDAARAERRRLEDKQRGTRRGLFGGKEASSADETSANESEEALVAFADEIKTKKWSFWRN